MIDFDVWARKRVGERPMIIRARVATMRDCERLVMHEQSELVAERHAVADPPGDGQQARR